MYGVPKVVLILCLLFWKLEFLHICGLCTGPEAPPNDETFTKVVAERFYRNCCFPGERLAPESRVYIHAVDMLKQTAEGIKQEIANYMRSFTHVIIISEAFHIWEIMERDCGRDTPKFVGQLTHRYICREFADEGRDCKRGDDFAIFSFW